jgi:ribosome recycling factor
MFNKIVVDYYGAMTPINQLSSLTVPEPAMAVISPYDKSSLGLIERAIRDSDLGRQPVQRRQHHPHRLPAAHRGARKEFIKVARSKAEDARVSIRNIRRKAKEELDRLVKDGETGEDEVTRAEKELEKTTAQYVHTVDELLRHKEAELLEV